MLPIETKRFTFEQYEAKHLPFLLNMVQNPRVMQFIGNGEVKDAVYAHHLIERMQAQYANFGDYGLHVLVDKETHAYIGHAGLVAQVIDDAFEIELGYWIDEPYWQQGYGFEAAQALAHYAENVLWLERYISAIQVGNKGSRAIALKNGLICEKIIEMEGKQVEIFVKYNEWEEDE